MGIKTSNLGLRRRMRESLSDTFMRASIANAQDRINPMRADCCAELDRYEQWRELAAGIRAHTLENLDFYLGQFAGNARRAGSVVHFARDAREAAAVARTVFLQKKARRGVKSKSMVTEEIGLNEALEEIGVQILETDLGEYLLQIDGRDKPSHIVIPALHKNRERIREVLAGQTGYTGDSAPESMTRHVRQILRKAFLEADVGVTGCNFAVASSGSVALLTNEGNGRFVSGIPETLITFVGMERVVPELGDLDALCSLLPRSAVGARSTIYMTLTTGPQGAADVDGPGEHHIVLVDNGRSAVLGSRFRDVLRCIRCGACMLVCPAYRHVGGRGYGVLYPGPLGLALVPAMTGYAESGDLAGICSLCGACNDVCPVKIPLYELILEHRRAMAEDARRTGRVERLAFGQYGRILGNPGLYAAATRWARLANAAPRIGPLGAWSRSRELPRIPGERFRDWFARRRKEGRMD